MSEEYFDVIIKRDGRIVPFDEKKIANAIFKAAKAVGGSDYKKAEELTDLVTKELRKQFGRSAPNIEQVQDVIEKILIEEGHAKTSKAYILYREERAKSRDSLQVRKEVRSKADSTDLLLMVTSTKEEMFAWDKRRIANALVKEARIPMRVAEDIAKSVEERIFKSGLKAVSTALIRELVDNELFERGESSKLEKQTVLGMPIYDLEQIIFAKSDENSNVASNSPEAVNLAIAENTLKQYALKHVFTPDIAKAHLTGALHLHDLGYPTRVYCSGHSLEYIKKYGLRLINLSTASKPAKHAWTLTGHLNTFLASMQAYYAGALGIAFLNTIYAPLLVGLDDKELKQQAQYLIYSCSQNAFSRGGQTLFIDFNIDLGVPSYLKDTPAIGPGGKYTGKNYGEYEDETQRFAKALMDVWRAGDADGKPFPFPKFDLHVNQESFDDPKQYELLKYACQISSENGSPYFVFDRDEVTLAQCCRLKTKIEDKSILKHPERIRFCGFQNVTINLPQCAYRAGKGNVEGMIQEMRNTMDLAMKAHLQKRKFIEKMMVPNGPMWQVGKKAEDGNPYIDLNTATYILGILGLNECVKFLIEKELHNDEDAFKLGLKIISAMYLKANELSKAHNMKVSLEETPAESASLRLAKVDLQEFPVSKDYVRGDLDKKWVYYTNSIHLAPNADVDMIERIEKQGKFNTLIESGCITHLFVGEQRPPADSILTVVKKTWENTDSAQIVVSPEFTICNSCNKVSPGFKRNVKKTEDKGDVAVAKAKK